MYPALFTHKLYVINAWDLKHEHYICTVITPGRLRCTCINSWKMHVGFDLKWTSHSLCVRSSCGFEKTVLVGTSTGTLFLTQKKLESKCFIAYAFTNYFVHSFKNPLIVIIFTTSNWCLLLALLFIQCIQYISKQF